MVRSVRVSLLVLALALSGVDAIAQSLILSSADPDEPVAIPEASYTVPATPGAVVVIDMSGCT